MTDDVRSTPPHEIMETRHLLASDPAALAEAAAWLARGYPVVFPTDTVYGVGVIPYDGAAIERLYATKLRPSSKGIPILLADASEIWRVAAAVPPAAARLVERFWPGPLTLIVPRRPELPSVLAPGDTIAVRVPDHTVAQDLIRRAGGAVATSSANLSGQPPARSGLEALAVMDGYVAAVLDDGPAPGGLPSTIVDCTATPLSILRVGPLSAIDLGLAEAKPEQL